MTTFERKNAYVNGLKMFPSQFGDNKEVIRFTIKNEDLHFIIGQLEGAKAEGLPALVDIVHSEQDGKYGKFIGGSIRAVPRTPQVVEGGGAAVAAASSSAVADLKAKQVK